MEADDSARATQVAIALALWALEEPGLLGEEFDRRLGAAAAELHRPVVFDDAVPDLYDTVLAEHCDSDSDAITRLGETLVARTHARYRNRGDQRCFWAYNLTLGALTSTWSDDEAFAVRFLTEVIRWCETVEAVWGVLDMCTTGRTERRGALSGPGNQTEDRGSSRARRLMPDPQSVHWSLKRRLIPNATEVSGTAGSVGGGSAGRRRCG